MKIEGQKYLDKNNYSSIIISLLNEEYKVYVNCKKDYDSIKSECSLMEELKTLSSNEKILEIVEYFLRNNKIIEFVEVELEGYRGKFIDAYSSNGRLLALKLPDNEFGYLIGKKILNKYYSDRNEYCLNNDVTKIFTSFVGKGTYYGNNELCLLSKYNELLSSEVNFLKEFFLTKLDYEHKAKIEYLDREEIHGFNEVLYTFPYLICGDLKIQILDSSILEDVSIIIEQYNQELDRVKEKQLVLKGWDTYGKYNNG